MLERRGRAKGDEVKMQHGRIILIVLVSLLIVAVILSLFLGKGC